MKVLFKCLALTALFLANSPLPAPAANRSPEKLADGIIVPLNGSFLKIEVFADNVVRVASAKDRAFFARSTPATEVRRKEKTRWKLDTRDGVAMLSTAKLQVRVDLASGAVSFFDASGKSILAEKTGGQTLTPAKVQGEQTFHVRQQWEPNADESLYGLGQRQIGILDIKGWDLDLWQHNTHVVVPFLVSSRGYGVLWDNLSFTRFGDLREFTSIPADCLVDVSNQPGGLTTGTFTEANPDQLENAHRTNEISFPSRGRGGARGWTRWVGELVPPTTGDYQLKTYSNGRIKMWLDGKIVIDHWRQGWLTEYDQIKVKLEAGHHYAIKLEYGGDEANAMQLTWKTPTADDSTSLWSEVADGEDYYFVYGPALDTVVAGFRQLTGQASLMPEWAFGLWQSRQRYETSTQSLDVVDEFRRRAIPFDNIVQDWQYWPRNAWGSHQFDPKRFPDPDGWLKALHDRHAHVMISVWGKFYTGTTNFDAMQKAGFLYQPNLQEGLNDWIDFPYTFYDAFNPAARKLFWSQINTALFRKGIDAWWMDATEPDLTPSPPTLEGQRTHMMPTAAGTASREMNGYALLNSRGVYEGQRSARPARVHPHPLGLCRHPTLRHGHVVRRHDRDVDRAGQTNPRRPGLLCFRHAVLDHGHRRLHHGAKILHGKSHARGQRGMARTQHPLVPVRHVLPADAFARRTETARAVDVWRRQTSGVPDHRQIRPPALPPAAVHLLARRCDDAGRRDDDAAAGHGFPGRHRGP
jgi:alpha-D-xyloside xylohydrolase